MAWNNGFPATYQQMYMPQYQQPVYQQPNTRTVEIVPVDNEDSAAGFPVGMGATQMMIAKDDSFVAVKSVSVNGQSDFVIYDKRPPAPPAPTFNPKEYVRKDEIETLVAAALVAQTSQRKVKKEETE